MAKGLRKTIILNPDNPKEKAILDKLDEQYNYSEFIKDALSNYIKNNNNLHDDNSMIIQLPHNDNIITTQLSSNDNTIITPLPHDDNKFLIDVNKIADSDVNINISESEDPNKNALDFLTNSF